jgi:ribosomal protein S18 acetylase RimI-like enzyme
MGSTGAQQSSFQIVSATGETASAIADVIGSAAHWAEEHGHWNDWPVHYPVTAVHEALSRPDEEWMVALAPSGQIVGNVSLRWRDPRYWGEQGPNAGYVHLLAVRPTFMGRDLGRQLLKECNSRIRRRGRHLSRLDVPIQNTKLIAYYTKIGYEQVGVFNGHAYSAALMEASL